MLQELQLSWRSWVKFQRVSAQYLSILIISGSSHFHRGIKSEYIDVMGPVFCNTIRKVLLRIIQFDELETNFKRRPILVRKELWSLELEEVRNTYFVQKV